MSDEALAQAPGRILHLPTVAGAVAVSYNLPGVGALGFDSPTPADIFEGKVVTWNDPQIVRQNPGIKLPEMDIVVVHRSDPLSDQGGSMIASISFMRRGHPFRRVQAEKQGRTPSGAGTRFPARTE